MYYIEDIQILYQKRAVELTQHFLERVRERNLKLYDVQSAIMSGEIIEECSDDYPHPSVLVLGYIGKGRPLHVDIGMDDDRIWLITTYYPASDLWEDDYKTRKGDDSI